MLIRKKPPRSHALGEPLLHENHPLPVTRRDFVAAGFLSGPALVIGPAWLGALLKASRADAGVPLSPDIQALLGSGQCNVPTAAGGLPFICFDLAGGANLVGSEVLVGVQGGQTNFLSTAGYGKLGVPGNMVPTSSANIDASLGLLWHADGAIKRGILSKATTPATAAGTNGAVICAMSQNDTQNNPHNPMYGIAKAGAQGLLLTLAGTESTVSGGNSQAPMALVDPALQPTTISQPSDATALVNTGGATADPVAVAVLESQARISGGTTPYQAGNIGSFGGALSAPNGSTPGVQLYSDPVTDSALKNQVRCAYVKSANTAAVFGNPAALDPTQDPNIVGGTTPIFTASDFMDNDVQKTASVMKLVLDGFAGAGTITLGGYDYHDGTRATGEGRNFKAGQMIGAVLEYAQRVGKPVMIYVFSDGSLTSTGMVDSSTGGRGKLGWQGDNSSVASTFFLAYSPKGRPQLRNGTAGQQIGYFGSDGSVVSTSSPAANAVNQLVQVVILNYMGLLGTDAQFPTLFSTQSLGSASALAGLTAFARIV
ncbi:MAG: general secretion pathway protein GspF [Gammaproteobacteria bacterium]|nr:MAG: general secretion pathway protein GspF [Gammaproteobacteria bacterium]